MKDSLIETIGNLLGLLLVLAALLMIVMFFVRGIEWVDSFVYFWSIRITALDLFIVLPISLLLLLPKKTRGLGGTLLHWSSYVFGFSLWIACFISCFVFAGYTGIVIGLILAGIGIVPLAMLLAAFHGVWSFVAQTAGTVVFIYALRYFGLYMVAKAEEARAVQSAAFDIEPTEPAIE